MKIDIWSDVVCPFCCIGATQLEKALNTFAHKDSVEVVHHSYQLMPDAPTSSEKSIHEVLAKKLGAPVAQAKAMNEQVSQRAADEGLTYDMDAVVPVSSFDAHRLIHFATVHGKQDEAMQRLFAAYFTNGESIADHDVLLSIAEEIDLDTAASKALIESDDYADAVRKDIADAASKGITGVPFFIVDDTYAISGAQGVETFSQALQQIWHETHPLKTIGKTNADTCVDGVCAPTQH